MNLWPFPSLKKEKKKEKKKKKKKGKKRKRKRKNRIFSSEYIHIYTRADIELEVPKLIT
jgi:hypothetical protein